MKKLLTILLALLVVTGVVFAADPAPAGGESSLLTLGSTVEGVFKHGFQVSEDAPADLDSFNYGSPTKSDLDMESNTGEVVGYYAVRTNATSIVNVSFTLTAMKHQESSFYVPYELKLESVPNLTIGDRFTFEADQGQAHKIMGDARAWDTTEDDAWDGALTTDTVITSLATGGSGAIGLKLTATFEGDSNNLPPQGSYVGTVKAEIATN